jgi:hypothetical protein
MTTPARKSLERFQVPSPPLRGRESDGTNWVKTLTSYGTKRAHNTEFSPSSCDTFSEQVDSPIL